MNLLELLDKLDIEIISDILFTNKIMILFLTSKKFQEIIKNFKKVICIYNDNKVDVCLKKCDLLLDDFSKILKNISDNFTINKLDIQNCILIDIFNKFDIQNSNPKIYNLKINNYEQHIKLHNIIKDCCPLLTQLNFGDHLISPHLYYLDCLKILLSQCEVLYNK
jgi:hypothetical protein